MRTFPNYFLIMAGTLSALAAFLHLACIAFGASWYRFFGAGEQMAQLAEAGHWYPTVATLAISTVLAVWSLYAFSGAGVIGKLPFLRWVLVAITGVYLFRGLAFVFLVPSFPGNSTTFWVVSSSICLVIGGVYFVGLRQVWKHL